MNSVPSAGAEPPHALVPGQDGEHRGGPGDVDQPPPVVGEVAGRGHVAAAEQRHERGDRHDRDGAERRGERRVAQRGEVREAAGAQRVGDPAEDAGQRHELPGAGVAAEPARVAVADHQHDAEEGERDEGQLGAARAALAERPEHEHGDDGRRGDDQRRVLRPGVLERDVGEQVEAGEAERPEQPQLQPAALGPQRAGALERGEEHQEDRRRDEVADRRHLERVDLVQRGRGDGEHRAPGEGGGEGGEVAGHRSRRFDVDRTSWTVAQICR